VYKHDVLLLPNKGQRLTRSFSRDWKIPNYRGITKLRDEVKHQEINRMDYPTLDNFFIKVSGFRRKDLARVNHEDGVGTMCPRDTAACRPVGAVFL